MTRVRRGRWRTRLLVLGVVPIVLTTALCLKVLVMVEHDRAGRAALAEGDYSGARASFAANSLLNWFEPWVAPYNEGLALYRARDHKRAADHYKAALSEAPAHQKCRIAVNLALALEAGGDDAAGRGHLEAARSGWTAALATLQEEACDSPRGRDAEVAAARAISMRVLGKLSSSGAAAVLPFQPSPSERVEVYDATSQDQVERLLRMNGKAEAERRRAEERRERTDEPGRDGPVTQW
ncbi:MAG: hypothetical protein ABF306_03670 [Nocardioides marinisabuli]|uniref:tetratricopeptide repeat protein n=1 Tax=Nocardioides marinisabuli TaxID=419476 RepID=UPI00321BB290